MPTVEETPCPLCDAPPGSLYLVDVPRVRPLESSSGDVVPVMQCKRCDLELEGEYDPVGMWSFKSPEAKELPKGWAQ